MARKRSAIRNVSSGTIDYYEEDMLGSSRTLVQAGGTSPCFDADFLPFGYEKDVTTTCTQNYKFEGKERDTETLNDDFGSRYYTFRLGRWLSADWSSVPAPVPYANLTNPQTLNLYAMVSDNPESFADLTGHCGTGAPSEPCHDTHGQGPSSVEGEPGSSGIVNASCSLESCETYAESSAQGTQIAAQETAKKNSKSKPKPKQKLTFNTISGGQGSRTWAIQWQLSQKSSKGGWIVQQITLTDSKGHQLQYWEAWQVQAGSQFTTYNGIGDSRDDTLSPGILPHMTFTGSARFYEGLELPASFVSRNPDTIAGELRSTTIDPHLSTNAATDSVNRTWTSPW